MWRLLECDFELLVQSGFLYVPLLLDPEIVHELHQAPSTWNTSKAPQEPAVVIAVDGKHFVRAVSLTCLVENYANIHTRSYENLRRDLVHKHRLFPNVEGLSRHSKLKTILFEVMPHFIRRSRGSRKTRLGGRRGMVELLCETVDLPARYFEEARRYLATEPLRETLQQLEKRTIPPDSPEDGLISAGELRRWFREALQAAIAKSEMERARKELQEREQSKTEEASSALLLYLADRGSLERDGFGFSRIGSTEDYLVYVRTGEYALKDYYGRIYLFPDCRVAVDTTAHLGPLVIERYKHPFLFEHHARQEICLRGFRPPGVFSAENVINALEEGLTALLYGYDSRRRNGYHSLDRITMGSRTVDFDDYRVSREHPKIRSGQVQVKNEFR